jgi:nucleotide-binding universal stress UspA family protein
MFKNILLAYDGSENSMRAAKKVAEIAKVTADSLVKKVYVIDSKVSKGDVLHYSSKEEVNEIRRQR